MFIYTQYRKCAIKKAVFCLLEPQCLNLGRQILNLKSQYVFEVLKQKKKGAKIFSLVTVNNICHILVGWEILLFKIFLSNNIKICHGMLKTYLKVFSSYNHSYNCLLILLSNCFVDVLVGTWFYVNMPIQLRCIFVNDIAIFCFFESNVSLPVDCWIYLV